MARAQGNDLSEIFGYAPDDKSSAARKQWKSQECPFAGGTCIKHSHPAPGQTPIVFGSCSVVNRLRNRNREEVIICLQRLYANRYESLRACVYDAVGKQLPVFMAHDQAGITKARAADDDFFVLLGQKSGEEVSLSGEVRLSLDWVMVQVTNGAPSIAVPCEVQSIDITGNYYDNWKAYAEEQQEITDSRHGMNWANVWKRLIPQIVLKGAVASSSQLCRAGFYFVLPERVYRQFEKLVGQVPPPKTDAPGKGVLTIMTYALGPEVPEGRIRDLVHTRTRRMMLTDFAQAFASGKQLLPLGEQLDSKIYSRIALLLGSFGTGQGGLFE